jgi:hypothetical protein
MWNCDEDVEISTANQSEREGGDNIISPSVRVMTRQMHVSKVKKRKRNDTGEIWTNVTQTGLCS